MATHSISFNLVLGQVTSERLAELRIPAALRPHTTALAQAYAALKAAAGRTDAAVVTHGQATKNAQSAHEKLVFSVEALAAEISSADPNARKHPFAAYGTTPSALTTKTREGTARAVRELAQRVLATKPSKAVRDAAEACLTAARNLEVAHTKLAPSTVQKKRALEERTALCQEFVQTFETVKRVAKFVWRESPADYAAAFAPVERFRLNSKRSKKGQGAAEDPTTPTQPGAQPSAPVAGSGQPQPTAPTPPAGKPATPPVNAPALNGASTQLAS